MSMRELVMAARKHWVLVLLPVLVLGGAIGYLSMKTPPSYRSSATVYVTLSSSGSATDLNQGANYTQAQMLSFAQLATMPIVLEPAIEELGLGISPKQLAERVSASTPSGTSLLTVSVAGSSPQATAEAANAVAAELTTVIQALAPVSESGRGTITATIVKDAVPPAYPFSPNTKRNVMAAVFAGLLLGIVAAYLRQALDTRVRTARDVDAVIGVPVLGSVRPVKRAAGFSFAGFEGVGDAQGEEFRRIRTNLQMIGRVGTPKVFAVSSAVSGEGKSYTALRIAASFAAAGDRVLLIDADLRRPSIATALGIEGAAGLTECLVGRATFDEVAQVVGDALTVLASGAVPPNPSELLASREFEEILVRGRERFDVVVVDAPPLLPVADAVVISRIVLGIVLVVDVSRVRRAQIQRAVETVRLGGGRVVGAVLNRAKVSADESAYYAQAPRSRRGRRARSGPPTGLPDLTVRPLSRARPQDAAELRAVAGPVPTQHADERADERDGARVDERADERDGERVGERVDERADGPRSGRDDGPERATHEPEPLRGDEPRHDEAESAPASSAPVHAPTGGA